ncbi:LPXTG cell wall anchor domain-containing protein [Catellatospora sp. NPDC049111]|jgi:LPXTG-motif cell wall-anchored protein|uniref:LPXTG cell wall anchor domain-containing protein n=1 Tax=Catellatospora sp. NPDC049111 TaxID=3155271 RepID=UPI0033F4ABB7
MKLRALLFLVLATAGLVVVISPAQPAWACSCAYAPGPEQDAHAQRIVLGTVAQVTNESIRLVVDSVEKGDVAIGETLGLRVSRSEASCGYQFEAGLRYRVNVYNGATGLCNGVVPAPPAVSAPSAAEPAAVSSPVVVAEPAPDRTSRSWWPVAGALLVLAAALGIVLRRRRRHSGPASWRPAPGTAPRR